MRPYNWKEIQHWHEMGHSRVECEKRFGFSTTSWYKAIKRGNLRARRPEPSRFNKNLPWREIQAYYDLGHSIRDCCKKFGFVISSWDKARKRGDVRSRPIKPELKVLLLRSKSRVAIKRRLLNEGILKNECCRCGIFEWRGKPLSIQIDHINGVNDDYRLENLRMLCANCHALTPTHGRRNVGKRFSALVLPWRRSSSPPNGSAFKIRTHRNITSKQCAVRFDSAPFLLGLRNIARPDVSGGCRRKLARCAYRRLPQFSRGVFPG